VLETAGQNLGGGANRHKAKGVVNVLVAVAHRVAPPLAMCNANIMRPNTPACKRSGGFFYSLNARAQGAATASAAPLLRPPCSALLAPALEQADHFSNQNSPSVSVWLLTTFPSTSWI
jgi:hypothetical protein